jgi:hypothetical protein
MEAAMAIDATDMAIGREIAEARDELLRVARENPGQEWWTGHELAVRARNGWSSAIVDLALRELLDEGEFERDSDLRIKLADR